MRIKANEHKETFDEWETPPSVMSLFGATSIDWAASKENTKAPMWVDKDEDALSLTVEQIRAKVDSTDPTYQHFVNPPYGNMPAWMGFIKRWKDAVGPRHSLYAVLPSNTDTRWFAQAAAMATRVIILTGRVKFLREGKEGGSPSNGTSIFHFKQESPTSPDIRIMTLPKGKSNARA